MSSKKLTKEHREKLSISKIGDLNPAKRPEVREKIRLAKLGKKRGPHTEETKKKISNSNKGRHLSPDTEFKEGYVSMFSGEKSHLWKGGITPENRKERENKEYYYFRRHCFERDRFTCQISGQYGGELVVHHINNFADFPELRYCIDNGITLSKEIHILFHKIYGRKNNTREQIEEFIKNYNENKYTKYNK